jgi:hypothetical protein
MAQDGKSETERDRGVKRPCVQRSTKRSNLPPYPSRSVIVVPGVIDQVVIYLNTLKTGWIIGKSSSLIVWVKCVSSNFLISKQIFMIAITYL